MAADTQAGSGPGHTPDLDPAGLVPRLRVFPITVCAWLGDNCVGNGLGNQDARKGKGEGHTLHT